MLVSYVDQMTQVSSNITMQMSKDMRDYNVEAMKPISSPLSIASTKNNVK